MLFVFSGNVEASVGVLPVSDMQGNGEPKERIESFGVSHDSAILVNVQPNVAPTLVNFVKKQRSKKNIFRLTGSEFHEEKKNAQCSQSIDYYDARHITFQYSRVNDFYVFTLRRIVI